MRRWDVARKVSGEMNRSIRAMTISDYPSAFALWRASEGVGLNESDTECACGLFLARNPGLSAVALAADGTLAGVLLCGHDGRRGYLHHLAVASSHRKQGIARRLIDWCFERLAAERIQKCNVFLFNDNVDGGSFWRHNGWQQRADLQVLQRLVSPISSGE